MSERFQIVLADPAWSYDQRGRGAAENHYSTMSIEQIQALPVPAIAAEDAVLFLWGTWPQLPVVLDTMRSWGFAYKTVAFVWVKYHEKSEKRCIGGGMWTRANTEFCLLGVRGDPPRRVDMGIRQLVETDEEDKILLAPRQRHSAKPPEVRDRIVQLMGDLPRVELFARERAAGWRAWGNQVPGGSDIGLEEEVRVSCTAVDSPIEDADENEINEGEDDMAFLPKGWGTEVANAEATVTRTRMVDGEYVMLHKACTGEKTKKGEAIIIAHRIIESKPIKEGVAPLPPGTEWGYFLPKYGDAAVMALPNMKAYALGLLGVDPAKVSKEELAATIDAIGDERQSARGMLIRGTTFHSTKEDGGDFLGMNWLPYHGENVLGAPSVLKRRADLDAEKGGSVPGSAQPPAIIAPPPIVTAPPIAVVDPFLGWTQHPQSAEHMYRGTEVKTKKELLAMAGR